ncbi:Helicase C-terminal [Penicillium sp. IBT 35674x]|nr:Helicase C-terminal [Penicillium sp. IBT 35674x]
MDAMDETLHLERIFYFPSANKNIGADSPMLQQLILCVRSHEPLKTKSEADMVAFPGSDNRSCTRLLNDFLEQSCNIYEELGGCATDFFIDACVSQLRNLAGEVEMGGFNREDMSYILQVLAPIQMSDGTADASNSVVHFSSKFERLLQYLLKMDQLEFSGLIFVREQTTVSVLTSLLSIHPSTKHRFRCAAYADGFNNGGRDRESIGDFISRDIQKDTVTEFRAGLKNLIIATDDLESLDVSCSLVVYFDKPSNLRSSVQRQGRIRHRKPTYAIMTSTFHDALPLRNAGLGFDQDKEIPALVDCAEQWDPYAELSQAWLSLSPDFYRTDIEFFRSECLDEDLKISIVLPKLVTMPDTIPIYWDSETTLIAKFKPSTPLHSLTSENIHLIRDITGIYFQAPSSRLQNPGRDYVVLFMPTVPLGQLQEWKNVNGGTQMLMEHYERDTSPIGIVRDTAKYSEPRLFRKWIHSGEGTKIRVETECETIPKRRNFLQPRTAAEARGEGPAKLFVIPAVGCTVDKLPAKKAMLGLLMSAILDRMEATMVAKRLNDTILRDIGIQNLSHILTAITTPIAQASTDYQLYEFFGDSVLKFTVACQLFFRQPMWHEGCLSENRDKLVQNKHLAYAALNTGLDSFILAKRFTPKKWTAPLISERLTGSAEPGKSSAPRRTLSSKVLADVVEALIGAAFLDGGIHKAQACLHRFLPEIDIFTSDISSYVTPTADSFRGERSLIDADSLESVIGYRFKDASLLTQALTHPSCEHDTSIQSYQRIEYLGDAVLDMLILPLLAAYTVQGEMSQGKMTLTKHSVVNANLLAFFCMGLSGTQNSMGVTHPSMISDSNELYLWRYLRFNGPTINFARQACLARFDDLRDEIAAKLQHGDYPWEPLTRLRPDKFMSDIMESVLGAIFIDSGGDLDQCRQFMERAGLLPYVRRILADDVDVIHPRNMAQSLVKFEGTLVFKSRRVEKKGAPATYYCQALLNKEEIASVGGCASSEEAEVRVAYLVIEKQSRV